LAGIASVGSHVIMKGLALIIPLYIIIHHWQAHEKDLSLTNNYVTQGEISSQSIYVWLVQTLHNHIREELSANRC
jgi:hypothetical protein